MVGGLGVKHGTFTQVVYEYTYIDIIYGVLCVVLSMRHGIYELLSCIYLCFV